MARTRDENLPHVSPLMWRWFTAYGRRFLRRHVHAVRVMRGGEPPTDLAPDEPLIFCCNHPSWWDPMVAMFLAQHFWPDRRHYWPIDAAMLAKYRFFAKLGFFGVQAGTRRGAATFLRAAGGVLARDRSALWVTAQGEFTDVRARPVLVKPGIEHLARWLGRGVIVPVAAEYVFWSERTPEALVRFGRPIRISDVPTTAVLEAALTETLDALAAGSIARDPRKYVTLLGGSAGTSAIYDGWQRLRALAARKPFQPAHLPEAAGPNDAAAGLPARSG